MTDPHANLVEKNYPGDASLLAKGIEVENLSQTDEDEERIITENRISDRCPEDGSDQIKLFTTKANHTVLRCAVCGNYFCPHLDCKHKLDKKAMNTRKGALYCIKCKNVL